MCWQFGPNSSATSVQNLDRPVSYNNDNPCSIYLKHVRYTHFLHDLQFKLYRGHVRKYISKSIKINPIHVYVHLNDTVALPE